jgi:hypothetical protein
MSVLAFFLESQYSRMYAQELANNSISASTHQQTHQRTQLTHGCFCAVKTSGVAATTGEDQSVG